MYKSFHVGQKVKIIAAGFSFSGMIGTITHESGYIYAVQFDNEVEYYGRLVDNLSFYKHALEPINTIGVCGKCSSIIPKERTLCCSCNKL